MIGGTAPMGFAQIATALPHIRSGKLRPYATTGATRADALPTVPTMKELGHEAMTATVWFGLAAPRGLPDDIRARLTQLHERIAGSAPFVTRMTDAALTPSPDLRRRLREEDAGRIGAVGAHRQGDGVHDRVGALAIMRARGRPR
jgi:tripartite-type tricarboxylate transporter receptor subunit TctC